MNQQLSQASPGGLFTGALSPGTTETATEPRNTREGLYRTCTAHALQSQLPWKRHCESTASPLGFVWKGYNFKCNRPEEQQGPVLQGESQTAPFPIQSFCSVGRTVPQQVTGASQRALAPPGIPQLTPRCSEANKCSDTTCHSRHSQLNDEMPFPTAPSK